MFELNRLIVPPKLRFARRYFDARAHIAVLDVGCGNHSPSLTKHWFPNCEYHGADIQQYNLDQSDRAALDRFWPVSADGLGYEALQDGYYDLILLNHVLEHMRQPYAILDRLISKLKKGGMIYVAFPSVRSLALPSARGTLHFCDDATHVFLPTLAETANVLLCRDVRITYGGRPRDAVRFFIGLVLLPVAFLQRLLTGAFSARGLWFVYGFEDCVVGIRRTEASAKD